MPDLPAWAVPGVDFEFAPGTYLRRIYWFSTKKIVIEIPCSGWQHAIVWFTKLGHIFCPYSELHYNLPVNHFFLEESEIPAVTPDRMLEYMKKKFDTKLTGLPHHIARLVAPEFIKPLIASNVPVLPSDVKPIKRQSKRGTFLQAILDGNVHIPTLANTLGMSRNNVLSYFYQMQKVNGIDYYLNKELDTVALHMPTHEVWI